MTPSDAVDYDYYSHRCLFMMIRDRDNVDHA